MKPIGGYFEWEFPTNDSSFMHSEGVLMNSGRHSLEYILESIGQIKRLWIPYYTCDVILQPLERMGISYAFYHIKNDLTLAHEIGLSDDEYLIYTDYFGLMDKYCNILADRYKGQLIVDNAQALFANHIEGTYSFYSPRKFVGVPDGGIAYSNKNVNAIIPKSFSYDKCMHLLKRHDLMPIDGYDDFKDSSHKIAISPMSLMSNLTHRMLSSINFTSVKDIRKSNFTYLHRFLADSNGLHIPSMNSFACPMVYPYYTDDPTLRDRLIANKVFVATYWPNVLNWCNENDVEFDLARRIIAIPIDQRYNAEDMQRILNIIN